MKRLVVILAAGLAACAPSGGQEEEPTESVTQIPTTMTTWSSPSPLPPRTRTPEQQAAEDVVNEYFSTRNAIRKDPLLDLKPLRAVVAGPDAEEDVALVEKNREEGLVQVGDYISVVTNSVPVAPGEVTVTVCTDASAMDMVKEASHESVLPKDRNYFTEWRITTKQVEGAWKISDFDTTDTGPCPME